VSWKKHATFHDITQCKVTKVSFIYKTQILTHPFFIYFYTELSHLIAKVSFHCSYCVKTFLLNSIILYHSSSNHMKLSPPKCYSLKQVGSWIEQYWHEICMYFFLLQLLWKTWGKKEIQKKFHVHSITTTQPYFSSVQIFRHHQHTLSCFILMQETFQKTWHLHRHHTMERSLWWIFLMINIILLFIYVNGNIVLCSTLFSSFLSILPLLIFLISPWSSQSPYYSLYSWKKLGEFVMTSHVQQTFFHIYSFSPLFSCNHFFSFLFSLYLFSFTTNVQQ